ncbi:hypothetical protein [Psychroserpens sp. NJDZ02]|uniref:FEKKY domain-containing protein n=1 Tax=Psychroserpens sp. NJDZ02 TaxID=2570561 RepID=UPI0010A770C9|nr:hypothetical protein [Psychroserpens sp. NJDZ02]QCE40237.1 hypothetical protein E9099_01960 [Psychroserpens sp. NJDZ02]
MNQKKIIFSGIIVFLIAIGLWYYGFFNQFNYLTAKSDIKNNTPHKVLVGEAIISPIEMNKVSQKYGFKNVGFGCLVSGSELNGIESYNSEIDKYLNKKNGPNWKFKYKKDIDSIIKLSKIPKTAFWVENNQKGHWFNLDSIHSHKNNAMISIYDKSGNLVIKNKFFKICPMDQPKLIDDLKMEIDFYDGKDIQLKDNCYLLQKN